MTRIACLSILACLILAAVAPAQVPDLATLDLIERATPAGPVALVDGQPISQEEFLFLYRTQIRAAAKQMGEGAVSDRVRTHAAIGVIRELSQREILHQEALRRGYTIPAKELDAALEQRKKAMQADLQKAGEVPMSSEDLARFEGEALRARLERGLLIKKVREELAKALAGSIQEKDARAFFEKEKDGLFRKPSGLRLSHILVRAAPPGQPPTDREWEAAEKRIDTAEKRIRAGESFEAVARSLSDAPDAVRGGDVGFKREADLPVVYADAARTMNPGDISAPLKSERAYHLIKLEERADEEPVSFESVKDQIMMALRETKTVEAVEDFCGPILDDGKRVRLFIRLQADLVGEGPTASAEKK
jgi:parvulin-like peptidyl-prolyl isomerase